MTNETEWRDVAALNDVWDGTGIEVQAGARTVALFRVGDQVFATAPLCTHGHARLCEGFVEGTSIECPLHQGRFDLASGRPLCDPVTEPLATYPVRVEGGRVWVSLA